MPTYEYACKSCGEHLEIVQSFRDDPLTECPACGGPVRKVFGSIGVVLKGSGFYKTDSRSSTSAKTSSKSEAKTSSNSDAKSDATSGSSSGGGSSKSSTSSEAKTA
jgi:putative FmdB family regulatory protein